MCAWKSLITSDFGFPQRHLPHFCSFLWSFSSVEKLSFWSLFLIYLSGLIHFQENSLCELPFYSFTWYLSENCLENLNMVERTVVHFELIKKDKIANNYKICFISYSYFLEQEIHFSEQIAALKYQDNYSVSFTTGKFPSWWKFSIRFHFSVLIKANEVFHSFLKPALGKIFHLNFERMR